MDYGIWVTDDGEMGRKEAFDFEQGKFAAEIWRNVVENLRLVE